jgi:PiT family inorganic phosphate transporter
MFPRAGTAVKTRSVNPRSCKLVPVIDPAMVVLVLVIAVALAFDFINGFHDTANAIATSVSTRVLTPRWAILMAATLNFVGALAVGTAVAKTIGKGIIDPAIATQWLVLAALAGAIVWDLVTWYWGIPSSSSHALVGGIIGAGIAGAGLDAIKWLDPKGVMLVLKGLVLSPTAGFAGAFILMLVLVNLLFRAPRNTVTGAFRWMQIGSAAFMSFSHGTNDAQKAMGIITLALATAGVVPKSEAGFFVPLWVMIACAVAMGLGTAVGGWRIIRTMGSKIVKLEPIHGFAAEVSAATTMMVAAQVGMPISTTHCISGAIMGVGATKRLSAVRWGVAGNIVIAWILTIPATATIAWLTYNGLLALGLK